MLSDLPTDVAVLKTETSDWSTFMGKACSPHEATTKHPLQTSSSTEVVDPALSGNATRGPKQPSRDRSENAHPSGSCCSRGGQDLAQTGSSLAEAEDPQKPPGILQAVQESVLTTISGYVPSDSDDADFLEDIYSIGLQETDPFLVRMWRLMMKWPPVSERRQGRMPSVIIAAPKSQEDFVACLNLVYRQTTIYYPSESHPFRLLENPRKFRWNVSRVTLPCPCRNMTGSERCSDCLSSSQQFLTLQSLLPSLIDSSVTSFSVMGIPVSKADRRLCLDTLGRGNLRIVLSRKPQPFRVIKRHPKVNHAASTSSDDGKRGNDPSGSPASRRKGKHRSREFHLARRRNRTEHKSSLLASLAPKDSGVLKNFRANMNKFSKGHVSFEDAVLQTPSGVFTDHDNNQTLGMANQAIPKSKQLISSVSADALTINNKANIPGGLLNLQSQRSQASLGTHTSPPNMMQMFPSLPGLLCCTAQCTQPVSNNTPATFYASAAVGPSVQLTQSAPFALPTPFYPHAAVAPLEHMGLVQQFPYDYSRLPYSQEAFSLDLTAWPQQYAAQPAPYCLPPTISPFPASDAGPSLPPSFPAVKNLLPHYAAQPASLDPTAQVPPPTITAPCCTGGPVAPLNPVASILTPSALTVPLAVMGFILPSEVLGTTPAVPDSAQEVPTGHQLPSAVSGHSESPGRPPHVADLTKAPIPYPVKPQGKGLEGPAKDIMSKRHSIDVTEASRISCHSDSGDALDIHPPLVKRHSVDVVGQSTKDSAWFKGLEHGLKQIINCKCDISDYAHHGNSNATSAMTGMTDILSRLRGCEDVACKLQATRAQLTERSGDRFQTLDQMTRRNSYPRTSLHQTHITNSDKPASKSDWEVVPTECRHKLPVRSRFNFHMVRSDSTKDDSGIFINRKKCRTPVQEETTSVQDGETDLNENPGAIQPLPPPALDTEITSAATDTNNVNICSTGNAQQTLTTNKSSQECSSAPSSTETKTARAANSKTPSPTPAAVPNVQAELKRMKSPREGSPTPRARKGPKPNYLLVFSRLETLDENVKKPKASSPSNARADRARAEGGSEAKLCKVSTVSVNAGSYSFCVSGSAPVLVPTTKASKVTGACAENEPTFARSPLSVAATSAFVKPVRQSKATATEEERNNEKAVNCSKGAEEQPCHNLQSQPATSKTPVTASPQPALTAAERRSRFKVTPTTNDQHGEESVVQPGTAVTSRFSVTRVQHDPAVTRVQHDPAVTRVQHDPAVTRVQHDPASAHQDSLSVLPDDVMLAAATANPAALTASSSETTLLSSSALPVTNTRNDVSVTTQCT